MNTLYRKLAEVAKDCAFAGFDKKNDFHGYSYASAASIIRAINTAMTARGLSLTVAESELLHYSTAPDAKGRPTTHATVRLTLRIVDAESGEGVSTMGIGEGSDSGDKAIAKANTSAYKYALAHCNVMSWGAEDPEKPSDADKDALAEQVAALEAAIEAADAGSLAQVRKDVLRLKNTPAYGGLVAKYKARAATLGK